MGSRGRLPTGSLVIPYEPPSHLVEAFNCPFCAAYASMNWIQAVQPDGHVIQDLRVAYCRQCHRYSIWHEKVMLLPPSGTAPMPNPDLPNEIRLDYEEAREIVSRSPRGAAALLRLAIQKLCVEAGQPGKDLNTDIGTLVKKGLPVEIQKALDIVRVVGNNAVHPGQIELKDDESIANQLFELVNLITDVLISQPARVREMYENLPETAKESIERRDGAGEAGAGSGPS